jgi:hypothetical protein
LFVTLTFINEHAAMSTSNSIGACEMAACVFFRGVMICPFLATSQPCPSRVLAPAKMEADSKSASRDSGSVTTGPDDVDAGGDNAAAASSSGNDSSDNVWMIVAIMLIVVLLVVLVALAVVVSQKRQSTRSGDENISIEAGLAKQGSNTFERRAIGETVDDQGQGVYTETVGNMGHSTSETNAAASLLTGVAPEHSQAPPVNYEVASTTPGVETTVPLYEVGDGLVVTPTQSSVGHYETPSYEQAGTSSTEHHDHAVKDSADALYSEADAAPPSTLRREEEPTVTPVPSFKIDGEGRLSVVSVRRNNPMSSSSVATGGN